MYYKSYKGVKMQRLSEILPVQQNGENMSNDIVKYESADGQMVNFTAQEVKDRLCPNIGDKELSMVIALCQAQKLNPFTKDVHIVKYGDNPAQIITSKEVFSKRANANKDYEGFEAGVTVISGGKIVHREGSAVYSAANEQLVGGWCRVFVNGKRPFYDEVTIEEYSTGKSLWNSKPATMIRKVAYVHCLREAFPDDFQGLYSSEEMGETGQMVEDTQNNASNAEKTASNDEVNVVAQAEFVELATDEQMKQYTDIALQFAELRGKTLEDVNNVVLQASSMKATGADSVDTFTPKQAETAISLISSWIERIEEQEHQQITYANDGLYEEDVDF